NFVFQTANPDKGSRRDDQRSGGNGPRRREPQARPHEPARSPDGSGAFPLGGEQHAAAQPRRWVYLWHSLAERECHLAELLQRRRAPPALRWLLLDTLPVGFVDRIERQPRGKLDDVVAHCRLGHHRSLHSWDRSGVRRSCCSPRRMRVLIVPRGWLSSAAISTCVRPRK